MNEPLILDGKALAKKIEENLIARVEKIKSETGVTPVLATILVGDNPASITYVRMKGNACARVGLGSLKVIMPESSTTEDVIKKIEELNTDGGVNGILLQHPVPGQIDELECFDSIATEKDVDGVNTRTFGLMSMKRESFVSATPLGIIKLLKYYNIQIEGKEAVVVGRSQILGKPAAMLLINENATVTVCHTKTKNLPEVIRRADIVVGAVGRPEFIKADWIKEGAVLVDAGYNPGNVGDIDIENAKSKCYAYTPVPGGVGPMTIACLMCQTVEAAEKRLNIQNLKTII